eukprot:m.6956 g.6956  ORF g.6956 m.6956 type:complete len:1394 (+) comp2686_c0_seq1:833-5014(+)
MAHNTSGIELLPSGVPPPATIEPLAPLDAQPSDLDIARHTPPRVTETFVFVYAQPLYKRHRSACCCCIPCLWARRQFDLVATTEGAVIEYGRPNNDGYEHHEVWVVEPTAASGADSALGAKIMALGGPPLANSAEQRGMVKTEDGSDFHFASSDAQLLQDFVRLVNCANLGHRETPNNLMSFLCDKTTFSIDHLNPSVTIRKIEPHQAAGSCCSCDCDDVLSICLSNPLVQLICCPFIALASCYMCLKACAKHPKVFCTPCIGCATCCTSCLSALCVSTPSEKRPLLLNGTVNISRIEGDDDDLVVGVNYLSVLRAINFLVKSKGVEFFSLVQTDAFYELVVRLEIMLMSLNAQNRSAFRAFVSIIVESLFLVRTSRQLQTRFTERACSALLGLIHAIETGRNTSSSGNRVGVRLKIASDDVDPFDVDEERRFKQRQVKAVQVPKRIVVTNHHLYPMSDSMIDPEVALKSLLSGNFDFNAFDDRYLRTTARSGGRPVYWRSGKYGFDRFLLFNEKASRWQLCRDYTLEDVVAYCEDDAQVPEAILGKWRCFELHDGHTVKKTRSLHFESASDVVTPDKPLILLEVVASKPIIASFLLDKHLTELHALAVRLERRVTSVEAHQELARKYINLINDVLSVIFKNGHLHHRRLVLQAFRGSEPRSIIELLVGVFVNATRLSAKDETVNLDAVITAQPTSQAPQQLPAVDPEEEQQHQGDQTAPAPDESKEDKIVGVSFKLTQLEVLCEMLRIPVMLRHDPGSDGDRLRKLFLNEALPQAFEIFFLSAVVTGKEKSIDKVHQGQVMLLYLVALMCELPECAVYISSQLSKLRQLFGTLQHHTSTGDFVFTNHSSVTSIPHFGKHFCEPILLLFKSLSGHCSDKRVAYALAAVNIVPTMVRLINTHAADELRATAAYILYQLFGTSEEYCILSEPPIVAGQGHYGGVQALVGLLNTGWSRSQAHATFALSKLLPFSSERQQKFVEHGGPDALMRLLRYVEDKKHPEFARGLRALLGELVNTGIQEQLLQLGLMSWIEEALTSKQTTTQGATEILGILIDVLKTNGPKLSSEHTQSILRRVGNFIHSGSNFAETKLFHPSTELPKSNLKSDVDNLVSSSDDAEVGSTHEAAATDDETEADTAQSAAEAGVPDQFEDTLIDDPKAVLANFAFVQGMVEGRIPQAVRNKVFLSFQKEQRATAENLAQFLRSKSFRVVLQDSKMIKADREKELDATAVIVALITAGYADPVLKRNIPILSINIGQIQPKEQVKQEASRNSDLKPIFLRQGAESTAFEKAASVLESKFGHCREGGASPAHSGQGGVSSRPSSQMITQEPLPQRPTVSSEPAPPPRPTSLVSDTVNPPLPPRSQRGSLGLTHPDFEETPFQSHTSTDDFGFDHE